MTAPGLPGGAPPEGAPQAPHGPAREAQRQQLLLQSLLRHEPSAQALPAWLQGPTHHQVRGLQAYRAHADASAERALAAAFPAVVRLVSAESFSALARAYRQARPPQRGDLAWLGEQLPDFIAADPQLAAVPYLADVARLEWLLDRAEGAADIEPDPNSLLMLADAEPAALRLRLAPGAALLRSRWPVVAIYQAQIGWGGEAGAHVNAEAEAARADALRRAHAALQSSEGECALVWRPLFKSRVCTLGPPQARFVEALLQGRSLAQALDDAGQEFAFESWLTWALQQGVLRGAVQGGEQPPVVSALGALGATDAVGATDSTGAAGGQHS